VGARIPKPHAALSFHLVYYAGQKTINTFT